MNLPPEDILNILQYLPIKDLNSFCLTSSNSRLLCTDDLLWKSMTQRIYGVTQKIDSNLSWLQNFIKLYNLYKFVYSIEDKFSKTIELIKEYGSYNNYTLNGRTYSFDGIVIVYNNPVEPKFATPSILESNEYVLVGIIHEGKIYGIYDIIDGSLFILNSIGISINGKQYNDLKMANILTMKHPYYTQYIMYLNRELIKNL